MENKCDQYLKNIVYILVKITEIVQVKNESVDVFTIFFQFSG